MNERPCITPQISSRHDHGGARILSHFGRRLVELAELPAGAHVLDVAARRGEIVFHAAARVGPNGLVIGIDRAADVVRGTAAEIERAALAHAEVRQMDAEDLQLRNETFDWVLCGFALSLFARPDRALQECVRVLKRGGGVAISAWSEDCPFLSWWREVVRPSALHQASEAECARRFDTPARLEAALHDAGFENIRTTFEDRDFVYADEEEWWLSLGSAGIWKQLDHLPESVMERVRIEMVDKVGFLRQPDGIHNPYRALFTLGAKPAR
jgi:ubiquinone/menaquinone biosynthesis C-methylase UbiE